MLIIGSEFKRNYIEKAKNKHAKYKYVRFACSGPSLTVSFSNQVRKSLLDIKLTSHQHSTVLIHLSTSQQ